MISCSQKPFAPLSCIVEILKSIDNTEWHLLPMSADTNTPKYTESQLYFQAAILENVSDIIISCSNDHLVKSWNKQAELFYNIKSADAIGKKITDLVQIDYTPGNREDAHRILYATGHWKGEVKYHMPAGETKYLLNTLSLVTDHKGNRMGVTVIGKDITDRKAAEEKLKQSELFYRNLFADSLDGIFLSDERGQLHFTSPAIKRILGYEPDEIIGRNAFDFVHPEDYEVAYKTFMNEVTETPEVKFIVIRLLRKNGEWLWCNVRGHSLLNNPYINRVAIYFYDDSLRKQAEDALKESEERFRHLISDLKLGVIMRDAEGKALMCNKAVLDFTGLKEEEFLKTTMHTSSVLFVKEDDTEVEIDEHPTMIASRTKKPVRDVVLGACSMRRKQWAWLLVNAEPIVNKEGVLLHVITTFTDITERRKLEQDLVKEEINKQKVITRATLDGQEKERKEIGKELHDNIGQHLTTTQLYLDIARESANDSTLELILLASKGISDVINEVRKLSRSITPPTLGDLGLIESIKDLVDSIKGTQVFDIRFYYRGFKETLLPEEGERLMLFRIVQEQVNNIIRHADANTVLIKLIPEENQLTLVIADNGKGFNLETRKKGLGINNIIARAELFNAKVQIKTSPGNGCIMSVTLPI